MLIPLGQLLPGAIIRTFNLFYSGAAAYAGLPAVMPVVSLLKLPRGIGATPAALGTGTVVDSQSDVSGSLAAFKNIHAISKTLAAPELYDSSQQYFLRVASESGAGYTVGSQVWSNGYVEVSA
jgi:hypothetical protein